MCLCKQCAHALSSSSGATIKHAEFNPCLSPPQHDTAGGLPTFLANGNKAAKAPTNDIGPAKEFGEKRLAKNAVQVAVLRTTGEFNLDINKQRSFISDPAYING